jgi:hypothetical protein
MWWRARGTRPSRRCTRCWTCTRPETVSRRALQPQRQNIRGAAAHRRRDGPRAFRAARRDLRERERGEKNGKKDGGQHRELARITNLRVGLSIRREAPGSTAVMRLLCFVPELGRPCERESAWNLHALLDRCAPCAPGVIRQCFRGLKSSLQANIDELSPSRLECDWC